MIEEIQNQIKYKELEQIKNPNKTYIRTEITILQNKLQNILQEEINKNLKFVKQKFFAGENKVGRLMALLIKKRRIKTYITNLRIEEKEITDHVGIKEAFVKYFREFYKSKQIDNKRIKDYLNKCEINSISEELKEELIKKSLQKRFSN